MFLLFLRDLALVLIVCYLLGCDTDNNSTSDEIPTVTIEIIESTLGFQQEKEGILFRINVVPAPTAALAVLIESEVWDAAPENRESGYTWIIIPEFMNSKEFSLWLDKRVSWELVVLDLSEVNLNVYPIEGSDVPANFKFRKYAVGNPSSVVTATVLTASLRDVWPDSHLSIPANGILVLTFDPLPRNIAVSHGQVIIDGGVIKVVGPFPLGTLRLEISWDDGRGSSMVHRTISEPDFEFPKFIRAVAFTEDGFGVIFDENSWVPPDTEKIELVFSEAIWVSESMRGYIDIQTVADLSLGWEETVRLLNLNTIILARSGGKPLNPGTAYVVMGMVTDLANEIEVWLPLTTSDR
ncbi:hypothetical protein C6502_04860 [Candidatus Poribacteria bacterium]|nr:MAG: hypothetical protein C6502_04860 [Candidatus Poribacteria bacterium]